MSTRRRWVDGVLLTGVGMVCGTVFGALLGAGALVVSAASHPVPSNYFSPWDYLPYYIVVGIALGLFFGLLAGMLSGILYVIIPRKFSVWRVGALVAGPLISSGVTYFAALQFILAANGWLFVAIVTILGSTGFILLMRCWNRRYALVEP